MESEEIQRDSRRKIDIQNCLRLLCFSPHSPQTLQSATRLRSHTYYTLTHIHPLINFLGILFVIIVMAINAVHLSPTNKAKLWTIDSTICNNHVLLTCKEKSHVQWQLAIAIWYYLLYQTCCFKSGNAYSPHLHPSPPPSLSPSTHITSHSPHHKIMIPCTTLQLRYFQLISSLLWPSKSLAHEESLGRARAPPKFP